MKYIVLLMAMALVIPLVSANSIVDVEVASQLPTSVSPGENVEVVVTVTNTGGDPAENLNIVFDDNNYPFTLINKDNKEVNINSLGSYKDYQIRYDLNVAQGVLPGELDFDVTIERDGTNSVLNKKIPVVIGDSSARLVIEDISLENDYLVPGKVSSVEFTVTNKGSSMIRDASLKLNLEKEMQGDLVVNDLPFAPVNGSSMVHIGSIFSGESKDVSFNLRTYVDANTDLYKVPISLSYTDSLGESFSDEVISGIRVDDVSQVEVSIDDISFNPSAKTGEVTFLLLNNGLSDVRLMTVELSDSDSVKVLGGSTKEYIGSLESDDFDTARFNFDYNESADFNVLLSFRDGANELHEMQFNFSESAPVDSGSGINLATILLVIFVIAIGYVIYRKRK